MHDVALQNLPVRFAIDRAGLVGQDGAPHAGAEKCSFCCSVQQRDGPWCRPEALSTGHPSDVRYRICPTCAGRLREATKATVSGIIPGKPVVNGFGPVLAVSDDANRLRG